MATSLAKQIGFAFWAVLAMLLMPYTGTVQPSTNEALNSTDEAMEVITISSGFNASDGYIPFNISVNSNDGEPVLDRPVIDFQTIPGPAMMFPRTAGCLAYNEVTDESWLIGGRYDPNPIAPGDEESTNLIEQFHMTDQTWSSRPNSLPQAQAYHECVTVDEKIYSIGDYHPFATPEVRSEGIVQIYDSTTDNWTDGTSMPATTGVGLAGMDTLDGFIYVAGGVSRQDRSDVSNRTLRYNPATDVWDSMTNMSAPRHSFELVTYHGKLYALGGFVRLFDAALNQTTTAPANHTEIYDPVTNMWSNGSDLPFKIAAHAAVVHNDEIIIAGGVSSSGQYDQVRGYNPYTGELHAHSPLHTSMFDFDLINVNGSILYAGGDQSTWRFSSWSTSYSDVSAIHANPGSQSGTLLSAVLDLRSGSEASATPLWIDFVGMSPQNTSLNMQYKTGATIADMSNGIWRPLGPNQSSEFLAIGNHTITDATPGDSLIQYRIFFETSQLNDWTIPTLSQISVGSEEAGFVSAPPSVLNPNAAVTVVETFHASYASTSVYTLSIQPTSEDGYSIVGLDTAVLSYNPSTSSLSIEDPDGMIRTADPTASHSTGPKGDTVAWSFAVNDGVLTPHLRMGAATLGLQNTTYVSSTSTTIDKQLKVEITSLTSNFSSEGNASVEDEETYPGDAPMTAMVDHSFTNSEARLLNGLIEARINVDVVATQAFGGGTYTNHGVWTTLTTGETTAIEVLIPNGTSGDARIWLDARTSDDLELLVLAYNQTVKINIEAPVLTSTTPNMGAYSNQQNQRSVTLTYNDVGGFSNQTLQGYLWIEAIHDTSGNGAAEENEYQSHPYALSNTGDEWTVTFSVNDSGNEDHQNVRVWLKGTDLAGYSIGETTAANGTLGWESRTPSKGQVLAYLAIGEDQNPDTARLEPTKAFGWRVEVSDTNKISDITRVTLLLGNDATLGLRYNANFDTCEALDVRIQAAPTCTATIGETIVIDFHASVDWTFVTPGTHDGRVEIMVEDYDGVTSVLYEQQWTLEQQMNVVLESLRDIEGDAQGNLTEGWSIASGETIQLNASMYHALSNTSYTGPVSVYWNGKLQNDRWSGGTSGEANDGALSIEFQAPLGAGILFETILSVWDPYATKELLTIELPTLRIDGEAPRLLDSTLGTGYSRFHLSSVEIGVNIEEANLWSSNLTLTCQVRSLDESWPLLTLSKASSTVFDGKTMFSYLFDFSALGDPSLLSTQANIACWAEGSDDAGWELVATTGTSELEPWLVLPLSNIGPDVVIDDVEVTGSKEAGGTMRIAVKLVSAGEAIDEPFNISIYAESNGERTLVGREVVPKIGMNKATTFRSTIEVPSGTWTLYVEADAEKAIWEVDENNNAWNRTFSPASDGFGSGLALVGSGVGVILLVGAVLLFKRKNPSEFESEVELSAPAESGTSTKPLKGPPERSTQPKPKPAGLKGPPRRAPSVPVESTPTIDGAAALDALVPEPVSQETDSTVGSTVKEWSELPPGGAYDYGLDETLYIGDECGTWRMNEDKSFTKIQ